MQHALLLNQPMNLFIKTKMAGCSGPMPNMARSTGWNRSSSCWKWSASAFGSGASPSRIFHEETLTRSKDFSSCMRHSYLS